MFQAKMLPIYLGKFSQISAWRGFCLTSADIWRLADWFLQVISTKTGAVKQITVSVGIYWLSDFCLGDNNYKYWMGVSNMTFIFHFIWMNSMIFQRGRSTTNQYNNYKYWMVVSNIFYFPVHIWDLLFLIFFGITTYDNVTTHMIVKKNRDVHGPVAGHCGSDAKLLWSWFGAAHWKPPQVELGKLAISTPGNWMYN
jgi:hypothetical protein